MIRVKYIYIVFFVLFGVCAFAQTDIPDEPVFVSASIIPESNPTEVKLSWLPSDSLDVEGYIVYEVVNNITETIDTVWGRLNTTYSYNVASASSNPKKFRLAAFDVLRYKSSITDPHTTMCLTNEYDKCNMEVRLSWTDYLGWEDGVYLYRVYRRSIASSYELVEGLYDNQLEFVDDGLDYNSIYYYYIEAVRDNGDIASSNSVEVLTETFTNPAYMLAESASVIDDNIIVKFVVDDSGEVLEYHIQRALSADGNYTTIKTFSNIGQTDLIYTDTEVIVDENRYYYRLVSLNPCGIISSYSNVSSNILLTAETALDLSHAIEWTEYYDWTNGVSNYKVFRHFDGFSSEIAVNTAGSLDYLYNIDWYVNYCHNKKMHMTNKFCYYVEAYENEGHIFSSSQGVSRSNVACVYHYPVVWLPTTFNITSFEEENRTFKPVLSFVESEPYEFVIFDKWGIEIFRTNKTYEGWNGLLDYSTAPSQYYTYYVRYYDHKGSEYLKTGTFLLFVK